MTYLPMQPLTLVVVFLCFSSFFSHAATNTPALSLTEALTRSDAIEQKPATFDRWSDRIDYLHDNFHNVLQSRTESTDLYLAKGVESGEQTPISRFRLGLYIESDLDDGFTLRFDPDFEAEINLPNAENRWKIIISGKDIDEMPDTVPSEREKGATAGVQKKLKNLPIDLSVGVRLRLPPEGFVKLTWKTRWDVGNWRIVPSQKVFYETDEGFGEVTTLAATRLFGGNSRGVLGSVSSARLTEKTDGLEWSQSLRLGYIGETIEKDYRRKSIRTDDLARGVGMKIVAYGHDNGSTSIIDRYRLTFTHRRPLYKKWIYLEISPEVQWRNIYEWDPEYTLRIGFDMLFWGTEDR